MLSTLGALESWSVFASRIFELLMEHKQEFIYGKAYFVHLKTTVVNCYVEIFVEKILAYDTI